MINALTVPVSYTTRIIEKSIIENLGGKFQAVYRKVQ